MALGSPIGSPNVGAYPTSNTQSGPQFLPGYLMGDVTTQVSIRLTNVFKIVPLGLQRFEFRCLSEIRTYFKHSA